MAYAIVEKTSGTTVPNNSIQKVTGLSQVDASAGGVWNNGSQSFVTPAGVSNAWHDVWANVEWQGEQQGAHLVEAKVNRAGGGSERFTLDQRDGDWSVTATTNLVQGGFLTIRLSAGDEVELWVRQISGATQVLDRVRQFAVRAW